MKDDLDRLLNESSVRPLAFAIALGWSLYQFAHGVATFVDALTTHVPALGGSTIPYFNGGGLTWFVSDRIVTLDGMVMGLIEIGVVVAAALLVNRHLSPRRR